MSWRRRVDCLSALLGMNGLAAAWPTRCMSGTTISRLVVARGASTGASPRNLRTTGSRRKTRFDIASASAVTVAKSRTPKMNSWLTMASHLDRDDFPNRDQADRLQHDRPAQYLETFARVDENARVFRIDHVHDRVGDRRQDEQDVADHPALRRDRFHVLLKADARADHVADVGQHFRQVPAGRPLDQHRGDEEGEVRRAHAVGHFLHRLLERRAEAVLVVAAAELAG